MKKLILVLLLPASFFMKNNPKELQIADLMKCVGAHFDKQMVFDTSAIAGASSNDRERLFPVLVEKIVKYPQQYSLFGIPADEIYFALDSQQTTVGVFIRLDNQDLLAKIKNAIPGGYTGAGMGDELSSYLWDYRNGCIGLELTKHQMQFVPRIVRDDGLIVFFNCDHWSYMIKPPGYEE